MIDIEKRRHHEDNSQVAFLFYLLIDTSFSMHLEIDALNRKILEFRDAIRLQPMLEDVANFGILSFANSAHVELPLGNLARAELSPDLLSAEGATSYGAAFRLLKQTIEDDIKRLKANNATSVASGGEQFRFYRPAVYFLTDGYPTDDDWEAAFSDLTSSNRYPLFIPFGFRDADEGVLRRLVYPLDVSRLYMARDGVSVAAVLEQMMSAMLNSVLASSFSSFGQPKLELPKVDQATGIRESQFVDSDFV